MDRLVYTALSGLRRAEFAQGITAHNLANATTTGFRRDVGSFQSQWLAGVDLETRAQAGAQILGSDLAAGQVSMTGRSLDVAMAGDAMLAVEAPGAGGEAYTRRGDLQTGVDGILRTGDGLTVLGEAGPIVVPQAERIAVAEDGTVSVRLPGDDDAAPMQPVGRLKLVDAAAGAVTKSVDGLFRGQAGEPLPPDPAMRLSAGALEGSNVTPVAALTDLIEQSRAFELHTKLVGEARDLDQASAQLMRLE